MFDHRLVFVSGKGGVGKSAVAAAVAIAAAHRGANVLAMGITDAVGIAAHLGAHDVAYEPAPVRPGISVGVMDRAAALDEYLKLQLRVPTMAPTAQLTRALDLLVDTAPGVREIISIGKPIYEVWKDRWDLVVVDAPPLGQIQSYLQAPQTIAGLVPTGAVRDQAAAIGITLADRATTGLVLVTIPSELAVNETKQGLDDLRSTGTIHVTTTVVNRVLPPLDVDPEALDAVPDGPPKEAAAFHLALYEDQRRWIAELGETIEFPYLFGMLTPEEVAARLALELEELP